VYKKCWSHRQQYRKNKNITSKDTKHPFGLMVRKHSVTVTLTWNI